MPGSRNMSSIRPAAYARIFFWLTAALSVTGLFGIRIVNGPSEEWLYTARILDLILPLALFASLLALWLLHSSASRSHILIPGILLGAAFLCIFIPLLSPNYLDCSWQVQYLLSFLWGACFALSGISCFLLAKGPAVSVWTLCIAGSLLLALSCAEFFLLFTSQASDGIHDASSSSKYIASGEPLAQDDIWQTRECGTFPAATGTDYAFAHKSARFDETLFDVKYDINGNGHRQVPAASAKAQNDLLLFGCSFTFGHGLDTADTWPWRLASMLGSDWRLENYAQNGFGATQMLCLLEHDLIIPPSGQRRYALFLAINHHLRRNEFFAGTPHYILNADSIPKREGKGSYIWLNTLDRTINGSQLARTVSAISANAIAKRHPEYTDTYLAVIARASKLLHEKYMTELFVLLWPDIEYLKPALEKMHIPVLLARNGLPDWDGDGGLQYSIHPVFEPHPNSQASDRLAEWLAEYFRNLAKSSDLRTAE